MRGKFQVVGHFAGEVTDGVSNRCMETRVKLPVRAEAAGRFGCFEDKYSLSAPRQVGRTD